MGKHKKKKHEALSSGRQISDGDICSAVGDLWKREYKLLLYVLGGGHSLAS